MENSDGNLSSLDKKLVDTHRDESEVKKDEKSQAEIN